MASLAEYPSHLLAFAPRRFGLRARLARAFGLPLEVDRITPWRVEQVLIRLRARHRRSVFIVDRFCGDGDRLIQAAKRARELGFVAIAAHGFDRRRSDIRAARKAGAEVRDPAIGLTFDLWPSGSPLPIEAGETDILLSQADEPPEETARILDPAGILIRC